MPQRRQLAAIMFTDIEGYTSIMQENEQQAIRWRNRHREPLQQQHQQFDGRIFQFYGDGMLSIFQSAVNAAACAFTPRYSIAKRADAEPYSFICYLYLGLSHLALRQFKEGIEVLEHLSAISHRFHLSQNALVIAYCKVWKFAKARVLLKELKEQAATKYVAHTLTGIAAGYLGEPDEAFAYLEQAFLEREPLLLSLKTQSWTPASLKEDPRYEVLLKKIGFP